MSKLKYADNFAEYVLGQLDPHLHEEIELHLAECEECREEVEATKRALFSLPFALDQVNPPQDLRDRILAAAGGELGETTSGGGGAWKWAAIAASIVAAVLSVVAITQYNSAVDTRALVDQMQVRLDELEDARARAQASLEELIRPGVVLVELGGTDEFPQVGGNVFLEPGLETARVFIRDLPPIADDLTYQLWVLVEDGDPVPSVTFVADGVVTEIETPVPALVAGFATTIEPAGGSPQPTGAMVVVGTL